MFFLNGLFALKAFSPFKDVTVDDKWDQVNRSYVFMLMCLFGFFTTLHDYSGDKINCDGFTKFSDSYARDFCWTVGLYTVKEAYDLPPDIVPYPGVIPKDIPACMPRMLKNGTMQHCPDENLVKDPERIFHLWYQWASFWFWLVAIVYYSPYMLFKALGASDYKPLIKVLAAANDGSDLDRVRYKVVMWLFLRFKTYIFSKGVHAWWQRNSFSILFLLTKVAYLGGTIMVFLITGMMFEHGNWYFYGAEYVGTRFTPYQFEEFRNRTLNKDILFPKVVSCEIKRWGPTGIEVETAQCVLAPNVMYQYFFLFSWYILVFAFFTNVVSCILHFSEMFFISGTYTRMIKDGMLQDKPEYRFVYEKIGAGGREIIQILTDNSNPVLFSMIYNDLVKLLVEDTAKVSRMTKNKAAFTNLNTISEVTINTEKTV